MKNRSLYSVLTRFGIVAAVLTALLVIAPAAAQEADTGPCNDAGTECDYDENGTDPIATYSSADPEGQGIEWSVGGTDGVDFDITGGVLTFKKSPNFEAPTDRMRDAVEVENVVIVTANPAMNNVYLVTITATEMLTEGQKPPAESESLDVQVTVKNVDEAGTISLDRLQPQQAVALTASLNDIDGPAGADMGTAITDGTWEWTIPKVSRPVLTTDAHWQDAPGDGNDMAAYTPNGDAIGNILRAKVTYNDGHGTGKTKHMLSYHMVRATPTGNNPPVFSDDTDELPAAVTVAEDVPVGRVIGTFAATDPNSGDILSYTLTGTNPNSFDIDIRTGRVTVAAALDFDASPGPDYSVTINAFDPSAGTGTHSLAVTTTNVNEPPTVGGGATTGPIPEINSTPPDDYTYAAYASEAFTAADQDADDDTSNLTLTLGGDDGSLFDIGDADAGVAGVVTFKDPPNLEAPKDANQDNMYKVDVIATDDQKLTGKTTLTITVTQVDEDGKASFSSIQPAIGVAITASVSDPDGSVTGESWQWARAQTAGGPFLPIDGATTDTYTPRAVIEDNPDTENVSEARTTDEGMFLQATVMYRDKASPTEDVDGGDGEDVAESTAPSATVMGTTDNAVRARPDVNNAPMFASETTMRDVKESETMNAGDAVTATDADGDEPAYSITGGADMDKFGVGNGGQITINSGTKLDFEGDQTSYELVVTAMDPFGESDSTTVTLTVTNVNEEPELTGGELAEDGYPENIAAVATFTAMDPEGADIKWDVGGTDGAKFDITGGVLTFKDAPNFEMPGDADHTAELDGGDPIIAGDADNAAANNEYVVIVMATETEIRPAPEDDTSNKLLAMKLIVVEVTDVQEPGMATIDWRQPEATTEISVEFTDPDRGQANDTGPMGPEYLWSVPKVSRPVVDNDGHWQAAAGTGSTSDGFNPNGDDVGEILRVRIMYTDAKGADMLYVLSDFPVRADVATGNVAPEFDPNGGFGTRNVKEDIAVGALVGAPIVAGDPNSADVGKLTYTLGGTHASLFKIDKATGQLSVGAALDHEAGGVDGVYSVGVTATDPTGGSDGSDTQSVAITATDVNDAPGVELANNTTEMTTVNENLANVAGTDNDESVLGTYVATDVDEGDRTDQNAVDTTKVKLSLGGEDAGAFKLDADDGELRFAASPDYESPVDTDGNSVYKVSIIATDDDDATGKRDVTVTVSNIDEPGKVELSNIQPAIGRPVVATLTDPDGGENNLMWQWHSGQSLTGTYTPIEDATTDTYTPKATVPAVEDDPETPTIDESAAEIPSDEGIYLQATVTYRDGQSEDDDATTENVEEGRRGVDTDANDNVDMRVLATSENAVRGTPATNSDPDFGTDPIILEVAENTAAGGSVGSAAAMDADGDTLAYEITGGADMGSFEINSDGLITVKAGTKLDFESDKILYTVEVTATDPFDGVGMASVTIMVTNKNEAPTLGIKPPPPAENVAPAFADDADTEFMVYENMDVGTDVGMVEATDEGDTLTYSVDSMYFAVDDMGNITTAMMLDHEAMASHMVMVTATDDDEASDSIAVTVTVGDMHPDCTVMDNNGLTNDCEALLDAMADLGGALDWVAGTPVAEWEGVTLSADDRVTRVWLKEEGLDGSVSAAFGRVEMLTVLNLHSNMLTGEIPDLSGATMLEGLYLPNNMLEGEIPASLNDMTNLTNLWLWGNQLTGGIPDLSGLTNLDMLKLAGNMLDGEINAMYLPSSLTWLIIDNNGFSGEIPDLSGLTSLKLLWLHTNALTGAIPDGTMLPPNVDDLNLRNNMLTGAIPDLSSLDMATRVRLHDNMLTGEVPATLGDLASLKQLWLWNNDLTSINAGLGDLSATLIEIGLNGNNWDADACVPIALADVATNDYGPDNIEVCAADDGS